MDRSEGERRAAVRPKDQPETEGSRASRRARSVTEEKRGGRFAGEIRQGADRKTGEGPWPRAAFPAEPRLIDPTAKRAAA